MAALPYIQLYVADYLADTMHLTALSSGAYLHLIMNYWQTGKPLKNMDARLALIAKCSPQEWDEIKGDVLEYFREEDGLLVHDRIDSDLKKVSGKSVSNSEINKEWKGYVYFISNESRSKIKIGYSKNPWARVKDLQIGSSEKLLLVATLKTTDVSQKKLHDELSDYQQQGEWFRDCVLIKSLIEAIKIKKVTTVEEAADYCRHYGVTTVDTTKDTDTDTDTDTDKSNRPKNKFSDDDFAMAEFMFERILVVADKTKKPNLETWAEVIRLMRERDKYHHDEIRQVFIWANEHSFWSTNILSPSKLRKQFVRLSAQVNKQISQPSLNKQESLETRNRAVAEEWVRSMSRNA